MKTIKIMILATITLFMVQCKENTGNPNGTTNDSQTVASIEEVNNTAQNSAASQREVSNSEVISSISENIKTETKQSTNTTNEATSIENVEFQPESTTHPKTETAPKKDISVEFQPETTTHPKTRTVSKKITQVSNTSSNGGKWYNLRYIDFQLKKGEEMKDQYTIIASENLKYLLYLNANNVPELGEAVNKKRQEESELVQTKTIYTFPTVKASWLNEPETKFFIQNDGNLQYVNPNKSYWALTDGRDKNIDLLHKVDKLMITDDGRIVLVDKSGTEIWSHR